MNKSVLVVLLVALLAMSAQGGFYGGFPFSGFGGLGYSGFVGLGYGGFGGLGGLDFSGFGGFGSLGLGKKIIIMKGGLYC